MKAVGYLLGACVILAVLKAVMAVVALAIVFAIVIGTFTRPRETLSLLGFCAFTTLIDTHPFLMLVAVALLIVAFITVPDPH